MTRRLGGFTLAENLKIFQSIRSFLGGLDPAALEDELDGHHFCLTVLDR